PGTGSRIRARRALFGSNCLFVRSPYRSLRTTVPTRLGVLGLQPIQYRTGLYRLLAAQQDLAVKVFYGDDYGVRPKWSQHHQRVFTWDGDHTSGYEHTFLKNISPAQVPASFWGKINPT